MKLLLAVKMDTMKETKQKQRKPKFSEIELRMLREEVLQIIINCLVKILYNFNQETKFLYQKMLILERDDR